MPAADGAERRDRSSRPRSRAVRLTAAKAEARKPTNGEADLDDRQEAARVVDQAADPAGAAVALLDELLDAAPADRDEGDLGGDEDPLEEGQDRR